MKKIICLIMALMLITIPAYAADIDLSSLSDEELQELQAKVNEEIVKRDIGVSTILPVGSYYVGTDIKAGSYIAEDDESDAADTIVLVYSNEEELNNMNWSQNYVLGKGKTAKVTLEDGQIMKVTMSPSYFMEAPVLPFAPDAE